MGERANRFAQRHPEFRFQTILTAAMVALFSVAFLAFSITVTQMSEDIIRKNVENNMSIVVNQFDVYLNNYIGSVYEGFQALESNQDLIQLRMVSRDTSTLSQRATRYLYVSRLTSQFQANNAASVSHVYINFGDGQISSQAYDHDPLKIDYSYEKWKTRFPENRYYWINADTCRDLIPNEEIGAVLFHMYSGNTPTENGIILVALRQSLFDDILNSADLEREADICLLTDGSSMHFGNENTARQIEQYAAVLDQRATENIRSEVADGYRFTYQQLKTTGWVLIYSVPENVISSTHFIVRNVILLTIAFIGIMTLLISLLSRTISAPLLELTSKVKAGDVLDHRIAVHSFTEIQTLSNGLEEMRQRIIRLLEEIKAEQELKRQTEIALLQEQINPHFLYNTLYSIMQLCDMGRNEEAGQMLEALSTFYRLGLNRGKNIITVREELEHVKNYLFIQHFRYSDLFDYTIDCDQDILECKIPKMSLQPLVENAIYHGIKGKHSFGSIVIQGGTQDGIHGWIEVIDDGVGFSPERLSELREQLQNVNADAGTSFGMRNVEARLKFEFGEKGGLQIESDAGTTCVRIFFVLKKEGGTE